MVRSRVSAIVRDEMSLVGPCLQKKKNTEISLTKWVELPSIRNWLYQKICGYNIISDFHYKLGIQCFLKALLAVRGRGNSTAGTRVYSKAYSQGFCLVISTCCDSLEVLIWKHHDVLYGIIIL